MAGAVAVFRQVGAMLGWYRAGGSGPTHDGSSIGNKSENIAIYPLVVAGWATGVGVGSSDMWHSLLVTHGALL